MIKLLGEMYRTRDGRKFDIDFVQIIPSTGAYDLVMFGVRGADSEFSMGVAFPHESASTWGANESLVREGLGQIRTQLDKGNTQDGSLVDIHNMGRLATELSILCPNKNPVRLSVVSAI